ncbi:hypothetical protein MILUP08_43450 [Micromonospora lupini str. Lupac 08]|uniref:Uncharacterized protein n=1 Tax=Micromonospora lupini str. Lupac 08 TaxID=1150864 RepID=I0L3Z3_9ACTN|nr:hypothetical protein MILUP08_43450 [Micromonospora lupini str. Lupac 08]
MSGRTLETFIRRLSTAAQLTRLFSGSFQS